MGRGRKRAKQRFTHASRGYSNARIRAMMMIMMMMPTTVDNEHDEEDYEDVPESQVSTL